MPLVVKFWRKETGSQLQTIKKAVSSTTNLVQKVAGRCKVRWVRMAYHVNQSYDVLALIAVGSNGMHKLQPAYQ